jgi:5'-deoxynucleotidase
MLKIKEALFGRLRGMHHVNRYSSVPLIHPENVAEHSWQVAMLSYLIGLDLRRRGYTIVMGMLLGRAITHDVEEGAGTGDIIRSFKYRSEEIKSAVEMGGRLLMGDLMNELGQESLEFYEDWTNAKDGLLEGHIVALADMLCVVSKCVSEYRMGNRQVNYILRAMYEENLYTWHQHEILGRYVNEVFPNCRWSDPIDAN